MTENEKYLSADVKFYREQAEKLADELMNATYVAAWTAVVPVHVHFKQWETTKRAVAEVLRELVGQGLTKKPSLVLDMADCLHQPEAAE